VNENAETAPPAPIAHSPLFLLYNELTLGCAGKYVNQTGALLSNWRPLLAYFNPLVGAQNANKQQHGTIVPTPALERLIDLFDSLCNCTHSRPLDV